MGREGFVVAIGLAVFAASCSSTAGERPAALPSTTVHFSSTTTSMSISVPATTAVSTSKAGAELDTYLTSEATAEAAAARAAGQTWNGYLHTGPVADGDTFVAMAAFSYDPGARPLRVLTYSGGRWEAAAALPPAPTGYITPPGAAMNSYWLATFPEAAISVADVTKDERPDFLVPLDGADNVPGAVVSQDGAPAGSGWRYVPYTQGASSAQKYIFVRSPLFLHDTLISTYDDCNPNCADGTDHTVTWTYEAKTGLFWAPSAP